MLAGSVLSVLTAVLLLGAPPPDRRPADVGAPHARPAAGAAEEPGAGPATERPVESRRVIADSRVLVPEAPRAVRRVAGELSVDQASLIAAIARKKGTYQSYLLYSFEDLRVPAPPPGVVLTLGPTGGRKAPTEAAAGGRPPR